MDHPSHCSPKSYIPYNSYVVFCKAHPSPIGICTNPSRDMDGSTLPTPVPNLIKYQNTCFAIQALLYSNLDQKWDGSPYSTPQINYYVLKWSFLKLTSLYTRSLKKKKGKLTSLSELVRHGSGSVRMRTSFCKWARLFGC